MSRLAMAMLGLAAALLAGCSRSPEELCEDFVDECDDGNSDVDQCVMRSQILEREAEDKGCMDQYYNYLDCVDAQESLCRTQFDCEIPRDDLRRCGVTFE
ncbi:MAG: hypothetical protein HOV80_39690 [Polyangiaceae bacterium]|nr:hypothetical protein [Polyangiaceae bacterium]